MLWDTHMHSSFSGDSESAPEEMIQGAIQKGLSGICFTDHMDMDYPEDPNPFLLNLPEYETKICALRDEYEDSFPINFGIELGLQPHLEATNNEIIAAHDFDFVIGSSHLVDHIDPYFPEYYEGRTEAEAYRRYFEYILENLACDVDFDVYGHIDYVVRYGPNKNKFYNYRDYADIIDEILKTLIKKDKGIEINTGGLKYGLGHPNPTEEILQRYHELGGEIITIGADAHRPEHIGFDFDKVPQILKDAGFQYYTVFTARVPSFIRLP